MTLKNLFLKSKFLCGKINNKYVLQYLMDTVGRKNIFYLLSFNVCVKRICSQGEQYRWFFLMLAERFIFIFLHVHIHEFIKLNMFMNISIDFVRKKRNYLQTRAPRSLMLVIKMTVRLCNKHCNFYPPFVLVKKTWQYLRYIPLITQLDTVVLYKIK